MTRFSSMSPNKPLLPTARLCLLPSARRPAADRRVGQTE